MDDRRERIKEIVSSSVHGNWRKRISDDPELVKFVMDSTDFLDGRFTFLTRVYYVINGLNEVVKCENCGKPMFKNAENLSVGIYPNCSRECAGKNKKTREKYRDTCNERFGCDNAFQSDAVKAKSRNTMVERYGVEFSSQSAELVEKRKRTCIERFGVDHQWKSSEVKRKIRETMSERHGADNPLASAEIASKFARTRKTGRYLQLTENKFVVPNFTLEEFVGCKDPSVTALSWKCVENGHDLVFDSVLDENNLVRHGAPARCPICHPMTNSFSQEEIEVFEFVKSVCGEESALNRTEENRKVIPPLEMDVIVPSKKVGIEFDGLYYHCDDSKDPLYHLKKTEMAESVGWRLIHVFEDEWANKREICESRLSAILGRVKRRIFARDCTVEEVSSKEADEFLDRTHLQGGVRSKACLALKYGGETVSVMTFGRPRFGKGYECELLRFSNALFTQVVGGASRLLSHFEREWRPTSMVSYADRRWSDGGLYRALGFDFVGFSRPSYWYVKNALKRENRIKYQKHKLPGLLERFDPSKTEMENMRDNGFRVIWDCGNGVYVRKRN